MSDRRVHVILTEKQLRYIQYALEQHTRLCMGQSHIELVDELSAQNVGRYEDDDDRNKAIWRREDARKKLQEFLDICFEKNTDRCRWTDDLRNEIDMWRTIRHWLWKQRPESERLPDVVESSPPLLFGKETPIEIGWEQCNTGREEG